MDKDLQQKVLSMAEEQKLPCAKALAIAKEAGCSPAEVGKVCNDNDVKVVGCQLGCF